MAQFGPPAQMYLTDLASHLDIIRESVALTASAGGIPADCEVIVAEFNWGVTDPAQFKPPLDWVVGTDVAYNPSLIEPLLTALGQLCGPDTRVFLGVSRADTGFAFFDALEQRGYDFALVPRYEAAKSFAVTDSTLVEIRRRRRVGA